MNVLISAWQPLTFPALLTVRTVRIESFMPLIRFFQRFACLLLVLARTLFQRLGRKPATAMHLSGTGADLVRGKQKLIVENVLLRHQLIVLRRSVARPSITATGRALLLLRAGHLRAWRPVLVIVQPDTPPPASSRIPLVPAMEVACQGGLAALAGSNGSPSQGDGRQQSPLGSRAHPW